MTENHSQEPNNDICPKTFKWEFLLVKLNSNYLLYWEKYFCFTFLVWESLLFQIFAMNIVL